MSHSIDVIIVDISMCVILYSTVGPYMGTLDLVCSSIFLNEKDTISK